MDSKPLQSYLESATDYYASQVKAYGVLHPLYSELCELAGEWGPEAGPGRQAKVTMDPMGVNISLYLDKNDNVIAVGPLWRKIRKTCPLKRRFHNIGGYLWVCYAIISGPYDTYDLDLHIHVERSKFCQRIKVGTSPTYRIACSPPEVELAMDERKQNLLKEAGPVIEGELVEQNLLDTDAKS